MIYSVVKTRGNTKGGVISGGAISKGGNYLGTGIGYQKYIGGRNIKGGKGKKGGTGTATAYRCKSTIYKEVEEVDGGARPEPPTK